MKRFMISYPLGLFVMFISFALSMCEVCCYYNLPIWHGNVTPTVITEQSDERFLNFDYDNGKKHGYTKYTNAIEDYLRYGKPSYMWCDVSRSGSSACFPPIPKAKR